MDNLTHSTLLGFLSASFYHFMVHDQTGPIGMWLRRAFRTVVILDVHDDTESSIVKFTTFVISSCMLLDGVWEFRSLQSAKVATTTTTITLECNSANIIGRQPQQVLRPCCNNNVNDATSNTTNNIHLAFAECAASIVGNARHCCCCCSCIQNGCTAAIMINPACDDATTTRTGLQPKRSRGHRRRTKVKGE